MQYTETKEKESQLQTAVRICVSIFHFNNLSLTDQIACCFGHGGHYVNGENNTYNLFYRGQVRSHSNDETSCRLCAKCHGEGRGDSGEEIIILVNVIH